MSTKPDQSHLEWKTPKLICHGSVKNLTRGGFSGGAADTGMMAGGTMMVMMTTGGMMMSDRRTKRDMVPIGKHQTGLPLYFYAYKPEFEGQAQDIRYIGFMADEVQEVIPDAVCRNKAGYLQVDYSLIAQL